MKNKKGISLIVLVITIIVMIILAAAVVITLSNTGVINKATHAVQLTDEKQVQDLASLLWAEAYLDEKRTDTIEKVVKDKLEEQGVSGDKWDIVVSDNGVTVSKKNNNSSNETNEDDYLVAGDILQGKWTLNDSVVWNADLYNFEFTLCEHFAVESFIGANLSPSEGGLKLREIIPITITPKKYLPLSWSESGGCWHAKTWCVRSTIDEVTNSNGEKSGQELYEWLCNNATRTDLEEISFYVDGVEYKTVEGMIWREWINSSYNTAGFAIIDNKIMKNNKTLYRVETNQCPGEVWVTNAWNYNLI